MPEKATTMMAGVETKPAETAVSPRTSAPTTDRDIPTYLGIRILASFKISKTSKTRNISRLGERGRPWILLAIVKVKDRGKSWILNSWVET